MQAAEWEMRVIYFAFVFFEKILRLNFSRNRLALPVALCGHHYR